MWVYSPICKRRGFFFFNIISFDFKYFYECMFIKIIC